LNINWNGYGIDSNKELDEPELKYFTDVIMKFIEKEI
jgi:hypothetical protein